MTIKTMNTEDARIRFRDILDATIAGDEVVIERYRKPTAVLVNYEQRQKEKARLAELERERHANLAFRIHDEMVADPAKDFA